MVSFPLKNVHFPTVSSPFNPELENSPPAKGNLVTIIVCWWRYIVYAIKYMMTTMHEMAEILHPRVYHIWLVIRVKSFSLKPKA